MGTTSTARSQKRRTALVLLATYNEADNIKKMIDQLFSLKLVEQGWQISVLVRDDKSPDGTGDIVRKLMKKYKSRLLLSQGNKEGLGKALQHAFDEALSLDFDAVLTMDADFSHSPSDVPRLLQAIDDGADVAIGSRYTEGGLIPGNWPLGLIIRTRVAAAVARLLGGINPDIRELTTNFRAMRTSVLREIDYRSVRASGYGFMIFLANEFGNDKHKVTEVPISFRNRAEGDSKASTTDILEFFRIAYQLNDDSPVKQVMRFLAVGMSGTVVNLTALRLLTRYLDMNAILISFLAIQISIVWNFSWHSAFTFRHYRKPARRIEKYSLLVSNYLKYQLASLVTQTITLASFALYTKIGIFYILAQALGILGAVFVSYYISSRHIWVRTRKYA